MGSDYGAHFSFFCKFQANLLFFSEIVRNFAALTD